MEHLVGQWIGSSYGGSNTGWIIVNIEARCPSQGTLCLIDDEPKNLYFCAWVNFTLHGKQVKGTFSDVKAFDPFSGEYLTPSTAEKKYPNLLFPSQGDIDGNLDKTSLLGNWRTNRETSAKFAIVKYKTPDFSKPDVTMSWSDFKSRFFNNFQGEGKKLIYRGQEAPFSLRTSFHRCDRNNVPLYSDQDLPNLEYYINSISDYKYHLNNDSDYSALLNLGQHHGFPTPLLDWTHSRFVAAFFAFRNKSKLEKTNKKFIRIFAFDYLEWNKDHPAPTVTRLSDPRPRIIVRDKLPVYENKRAIPQQSVVMYSNLDDIEGHIDVEEQMLSKKYLWKIDIDKRFRNDAMKDLREMGITSAALFPGYDGFCEMLKQRDFE